MKSVKHYGGCISPKPAGLIQAADLGLRPRGTAFLLDGLDALLALVEVAP
jgi:hypothetical protein